MKLYFKDVQGKERLLAECETVSDLHKEINKFLDKHNFKCYYMRSWGDEDRVTIDCGSYTEFMIIEGISHKDYICALEDSVE